MIESNQQSQPKTVKKPWKRVALPASYGSWSLVAEPILLGLFVAPTWAGLLLALVGFLSFLIYQPFKIILADRRRGRSFARTRLAAKVGLLYLVLLTAIIMAVIWLVGIQPFLPLVLAAPLMVVYVIYDQHAGRNWQSELTAPAAFSAISAAVALAAGWENPLALALWAVMVARSVPAVLYVRARLRLARGQPTTRVPALTAHLLAFMVIGFLVWMGLVPWTAVLAFLLLILRAILGLSKYRHDFAPMKLGWIETATGLAVVLVVAAGYWLS